ncbi:bifunctional metallophosphatase/5'-nucleotidase [Shewanella sp. WXL01]|uniref:bifunctional metallophosphatase/5'-nucleotidase n=1 Tax=Shewanella sp. WXL01 TaxID=2709721 RepID=UPI0014386AB8|nr:5'-nucleotidase C-terminal domain-containing protein [Shewanella sp. WXL01]NKF49999.1 bifunctional metallophosphatase/5'-nucleotidase [Shewanella sp. WXL01]
MQQSYRLHLAHINDTHSNFEPCNVRFTITDKEHTQDPNQNGNQGISHPQYQVATFSGGYARLGYQIEQARTKALQSDSEFLFLHGGDSFQGTLYFREFKGAANAHLLNLLKPDAMVLGNHEIDAGNSPVKAFLNRIEFPLLAGNMDLSQEDKTKDAKLSGHPMLYDYDNDSATAKVLLKPFYDQKIAIVGITLDQMKLIARPDADTHFVHAIDCTRRTVQALKAQGIHHILILSHLGLEQDRELAQAVDGISLIIGGHSHSLQGDFSELGLGKLEYGERINKTPIVQAGKYAETLGLAQIEFDKHGKVIALEGGNHFMLSQQVDIRPQPSENSDETSSLDPQSLSTITLERIKQTLKTHSADLGDTANQAIDDVIHSDYRPALDKLEDETLAYIPRDFIHTRLPSKDFPHGSELAPWVSRSMYKAAKKAEQDLDFALHNAGGVRQNLTKGRLSMADVVGRILPFELPLTLYQIQGVHLKAALESAIDAATNNGIAGTGTGSFPYPYGLRFSYDGKKRPGERVSEVQVYRNKLWQALELDSFYIGVSTAYTASGKEGYGPLLKAQWQKELQQQTLQEAFVDYVSQYSDKITEPLMRNVDFARHN